MNIVQRHQSLIPMLGIFRCISAHDIIATMKDNNPVIHFEMPFDDKKRSENFYHQVFNWQMSDWPMPDGSVHTSVRTTAIDEKDFTPLKQGEINGAIVPRSNEASMPIIFIQVNSIDTYAKDIVAAGGKIISTQHDVPGSGAYRYFKDTEGNTVGLWEANIKKI